MQFRGWPSELTLPCLSFLSVPYLTLSYINYAPFLSLPFNITLSCMTLPYFLYSIVYYLTLLYILTWPFLARFNPTVPACKNNVIVAKTLSYESWKIMFANGKKSDSSPSSLTARSWGRMEMMAIDFWPPGSSACFSAQYKEMTNLWSWVAGCDWLSVLNTKS